MHRGGLTSLLAAEVLGRNINACCGILRRIFSETLDTPNTLPGPSSLDLFLDVLALGKMCLADDASLVRSSSLVVLCHVSQRLGNWGDALFFAKSLARPPSPSFLSSLLTPGNYVVVLRHCEKWNWALDVPRATRVLAELHGSWTSALAVAEAMEHRSHMGERYTLGVLIPFLAVSGGWMRAVQLFLGGIAQGSLVDSCFVSDLVRRTARLKQWQMSFYMLWSIERTREGSHMLPYDVGFFRDLMTVSPGWRSSLSVFGMAVGAGVKPDKLMVSLLLCQCEEANAWLTATQVYDLAIREGFVRNINSESYQRLLRSFYAMRQWEKALAALSWMDKVGEASAALGLTDLLEMCQKSGQWEAAISIGSVLLDKHKDLNARTRLVYMFACAQGAAWQRSFVALQNSLHDAAEAPHPLLLCAALQACAAGGHWMKSLLLLQHTCNEEPRFILPPLAFRLAVKACVASGRWTESTLLLKEMTRRGLPRDNHSQHLSLWAAALSGDWLLSLSYLQSIPTAHRTPQDCLMVRRSAESASAVARAIALRYLQRHTM
ncbi:hypothetical protein TRVL_00624 [Trypanosoma vivax]|nr:hypothetical protein TRVL_00624 [Trypanosoma vivax]